jgi:hypothetical protein
MTFHPPVLFHPDCSTCIGKDVDEHRKRHMDLCCAIDMTRLHVALNEAVKAGMRRELADLYADQASILLALIISEHNRLFAVKRTAYAVL